MDLPIPIIGILRGIDAVFFEELMAASFDAGLQALEVTMNTPGAETMISRCRSHVPTGCFLGMGTIRNKPEAIRAADAGAMFLVSPNLDTEIIAFGKEAGIPVIAGALTPTEVYTAWQAGADLIKIFPCRAMGGPQYIRDLLGPFDHLPLVPVGGVDLESAGAYLAAGAKALGVGPALFGRQALSDKNATAAADNISRFIETCRLVGESA